MTYDPEPAPLEEVAPADTGPGRPLERLAVVRLTDLAALFAQITGEETQCGS